jgi:DNA-binding NarL/FixJ family response regulator
MAVAAEAADGQDALDQLAKMAVHATLPDVVLLDLVMPKMDGVAAASLITGRHPAVRVVILTSFGEMERVHAALAGGAVGYLLNSFVGSHLLVESIYRTEHRRRRLTAMSLQEVRHHG